MNSLKQADISQQMYNPPLNKQVNGNPYGVILAVQDPINGYVNPFLAQKQPAAVVNKKQVNSKED